MKGVNDGARWRATDKQSPMVSPPHCAAWVGRRGHQLLKLAMIMAMLVLLFSIYWSCSVHESALPIWLSLSFVSRSSLLLATADMQERPSTTFHPVPGPSLFLDDLSNFSLVQSVANSATLSNEESGDLRAQIENFNRSSHTGTSKNQIPAVKNDWSRPCPRSEPAMNRTSRLPEEEETQNLSGTITGSLVQTENDYTRNSVKRRESELDSGSCVQLRGSEIVWDGDGVQAPAPSPRHFVELPDLPETARTTLHVDRMVLQPGTVEKPMNARMKLEQELLSAKLAIEAATPDDNDLSLYPVIYRNISSFSKSYRLMEELFRIYVYQEGYRQLVHTGPLLGIYASEGHFIKHIDQPGSPFVEQDPEKAHMYFLPYSVTEMTLTIYVEGSHSMLPLNTFIKDYVNDLAAKYPFWNRTRGADHFFVSCHDWGPATARDHEELRTNAVKVVCNANLTEGFILGRDASLPEIYLHSLNPEKVGGPGLSRRPYLAFFAGQMHGHVRPLLIEHWKDKDPDMKIYEVLPKRIERKVNYVQHMKKSKFCICAAGFEVNSPRIVEAIYYDCVPVIISDNFVFPFSDVLDWNAFSLSIPESDIPNLKSILLSISEKQYRSMQKRLSKVRQHFLWNEQPVKYDVFHMILHSVWMSRLNHLHL